MPTGNSSDWSERLKTRLGLREARYPLAADWPFVRREKFFFTHIPKSGGTSFDEFLSTLFSAREILPPRLQILGPDYWKPADWRRYRYFHGGHPYLRVCQQKPAHFVTLLRDPVKRIVSQYWHLRRSGDLSDTLPEKAEPRQVLRKLARSLSLDEWVRLPVTQPGAYPRNTYIGLLTEGHLVVRRSGATQLRQLMERAKQALATEFAFCGIVEEYLRSKQLFCRIFGLPSHFADGEERCNVSPFTEARQPPSPETVEFIRRENAADLELYSYARRLFDERWAMFQELPRDEIEQWDGRLREGVVAPEAGELIFPARELRGSGLHREETRKSGRTHRWCGGLPVTTIDLAADLPVGAEATLRFHLARVISDKAYKSFAVTLDGSTPLRARTRWRFGHYEHYSRFRVTPEMAGRPLHRVEIHCETEYPPQTGDASDDKRPLGAAIQQIQLCWGPPRSLGTKVVKWMGHRLEQIWSRPRRAA